MNIPWSREEFELKLLDKGKMYHSHHPFQVAMNNGKSSKQKIQAWVANRYYYQIKIPQKDAAIIANCTDQAVRREWTQRILDHDGVNEDEGGIEAWLCLGEAVGLTRAELISLQHVLPGVKFAVEAYVNFAKTASWQDAVCASLTELFAPEIHQNRLDSWPEHYPWIDVNGYQYFRTRLNEARRDVEHGLRITLEHFKSYEQQQYALEILQFKLNILWAMLDSMQLAYVYHEPPFFNCQFN